MISPDLIDRAVESYRSGHVRTVDAEEGIYAVRSATDPQVFHSVTVTFAKYSCTCAHGQYRSGSWLDPCRHALAASIVAEVPVPLNVDAGEEE